MVTKFSFLLQAIAHIVSWADWRLLIGVYTQGGEHAHCVKQLHKCVIGLTKM